MELKVSSKKLGAPAVVSAQRGKAAAPAVKSPLVLRNPEDRLALSRQALSMLEQRNRENWEQAQKRWEQAQGQGSDQEKMLNSLERGLRAMKLCTRIAARLRAGDRVPPEYLLYLMKNDPAGYRLAMAMRKPKENPKEWESVLEDQDRREGTSENGGEGATPDGGQVSGGATL